MSNMYATAYTWNPFKGCEFDCIYCIPSFQQQAKRQRQLCGDCYRYTPHCHPDRLGSIPSAEIIFIAGNGDLAFCPPDLVHEILDAVARHQPRIPKTYYLQSKKPDCLAPFINRLSNDVILVTTLETNRDGGYDRISKAPPPSVRHRQFNNLDYPRKVVTIEPVLDFDLALFAGSIVELEPEYVWLGLNSRPRQVQLPEPPAAKLRLFVKALADAGIEVRLKQTRGWL